MNLHGDTIDVGTTRIPAPARVAPGGITHARLDPVLLADEEHVLPLVKEWTREELYAVAAVFSGEAGRRDDAELLAVLREWNVWEGPEPDALKVEFVTDSNGDDGVRWSKESYYIHHADGSVGEHKFLEGDDVFAEQDERFRELLAARSDADRPVHGAHLFVDLTTGVFTIEGSNAA